MPADTHFLRRTSRLEDLALQRAMTIYRDPNARAWLLQLALDAKMPGDARIAVPLGPQPSPAYVVLEPKGDVVTCLAEGMVVSDAMCLAWARVDEVFRRLPALSGADPDPRWSWRRLWCALIDTDGWLPREAYEVLLRERLMSSLVVPILLREAMESFQEMVNEATDVISCRADRQPKDFRAAMEKMIWHIRHLVNLVGDLEVSGAEHLLYPLLQMPYGYMDVAAGIALGRIGPRTFGSLVARFHAEKSPLDRANLVRAIALGAARQPSVAAEAGRFLKRVAERTVEENRVSDAMAMQTGMLSLFYLAAQGGRVGADVVSTFFGRPDPSVVAFYGALWRDSCGELRDRWPDAPWRGIDLCLPREEAEAAQRRGPRPCPEPLEERLGRQVLRTETKVHRNDPCPCGSGKKAKKCCGTEGKFEEHLATGMPHPFDAERRVFLRAMERIGREADPEAPPPRASRRGR